MCLLVKCLGFSKPQFPCMKRETSNSTFRIFGINTIMHAYHSAQCHLQSKFIIISYLVLFAITSVSCSSKTKFVISAFFLDT